MYSLVDTCVALHNSAHSLVYIDVCFLCTRINTCSNVHTSTYMLMYYHTHKNTKKQRQIHQLLSFCRHTHYTNCLPYVQIIPVAKQCFAMFVQWLVFDLVFILCCKTYWSITWQNRILVGFTDSCSIDINEVGFHVLILLKELSIMDSFLFVNSYHFLWGANMQSIVCVCNCIGNGYAEGGDNFMLHFPNRRNGSQSVYWNWHRHLKIAMCLWDIVTSDFAITKPEVLQLTGFATTNLIGTSDPLCL